MHGDLGGGRGRPLITADHQAKVLGYIDRGVEEGADLVVDGRGIKVPGHEHGFFVGPTLFDRDEPRMSIYRDEIFGRPAPLNDRPIPEFARDAGPKRFSMYS